MHGWRSRVRKHYIVCKPLRTVSRCWRNTKIWSTWYTVLSERGRIPQHFITSLAYFPSWIVGQKIGQLTPQQFSTVNLQEKCPLINIVSSLRISLLQDFKNFSCLWTSLRQTLLTFRLDLKSNMIQCMNITECLKPRCYLQWVSVRAYRPQQGTRYSSI